MHGVEARWDVLYAGSNPQHFTDEVLPCQLRFVSQFGQDHKRYAGEFLLHVLDGVDLRAVTHEGRINHVSKKHVVTFSSSKVPKRQCNIPAVAFFTKASQGADMLVLSRKKAESIVINDEIIITVVEIRGDKVRLGIQAPREVPVHRSEVYDAIKAHNETSGFTEPEPPVTKK